LQPGRRRLKMAQLNESKLNQFVGKMLGDLGGAFSVPTVRIGVSAFPITYATRLDTVRKLQGMSSSMRLWGWPSRMACRVTRM
jgi:hypothetical protein